MKAPKITSGPTTSSVALFLQPIPVNTPCLYFLTFWKKKTFKIMKEDFVTCDVAGLLVFVIAAKCKQILSLL